jgi:hypothetical protein
MSFRLFIYYCALVGGWAAFVGWMLGALIRPAEEPFKATIRGMWVGIAIALGLSLVDALWNLSTKQPLQILLRVGVAVLVGWLGGMFGGFLGQVLFVAFNNNGVFLVFGWTLTGLLVGASIGVFEILSGIVRQQDMEGAKKKLLKGLVGGTAGGLLGGILALLFRLIWGRVLGVGPGDMDRVWSPSSWGFVALGACIGLLVGLAQVILKEAWIKVEKGRRAGRELILSKERTTIGRAESCDIGLFGDNQVEKVHASILLLSNRYYLEDAATPAGTYVNDRKVVGRVPLNSGDLIRVGGSVLCFRERQKRGQPQMQPS